MEREVMESVRLLWEGVYNLSELERYDDLDYTMGVYMILDSRHNPVTGKWGSHRLLYIGKVYDQSFRTRLAQHVAGDDVWGWVRRNLENDATAKIGHVELVNGGRISRELVNDIEALLIKTQRPPGNLQSVTDYYGRDLRIHNEGMFRPLPSIISTDDVE